MITLVRRGALGDVVLLGSVTGALGDCAVVTDGRYLALAQRLIGVRRVIPWSGDLRLGGELVDLQGTRAARRIAPRAARIDKHSLRRRLRLVVRSLPPRPPVPALYGRACGVMPVPPPWIDVPAVPRDRLALIPGAGQAPKRWSPERFAEVGRSWDGPVVVLGGPGEEGLVEAVARAVPGAEALCESGFDRTIDAFARTAVAVAGDTGLMHLAGACGAPVVALFGPTHPSDGFFVYDGEVVQRDRWCRPCTLHRRAACPLGHGRCMDLPADRVAEAVRRCAG